MTLEKASKDLLGIRRFDSPTSKLHDCVFRADYIIMKDLILLFENQQICSDDKNVVERAMFTQRRGLQNLRQMLIFAVLYNTNVWVY